MKFSNRDKKFMKLAMEEAKKSYFEGEYPVGAVLVINERVIGKGGNSMEDSGNWTSHAENNLIERCSKRIKKEYLPKIKNNSKKDINIELFTTLEPCLMCLGSAILNRVSRIVFSYHDPHGGATNIDPKKLPKWYQDKWPNLEEGLLKKESRKLVMDFIKNQKEKFWKENLKLHKK